MTTTKLTLALSAAALMLSGTAYAAPGMMGGADMTRAQAQQMATKMFDRMDANKDGKIDSADKAARQAQRFAKLDTDKNGAISQSEFATAHADRGDRMGKRGEGKRRMGKRGGKHGMHGMHRGMGMKAVDANKDGVVTRAEFNAAAMARFAKADTDGNGMVTKAERAAQRAAMKQQWQQKRAAAAPAN